MDKKRSGRFTADPEINDFCKDLLLSVRQMKERKAAVKTLLKIADKYPQIVSEVASLTY